MPSVRVVPAGTSASSSGSNLYFGREGVLLAQPFNEQTLTVSGQPIALADDLWRDPTIDGYTAFSVARNDTVAYRPGGLLKSQLTWYDRSGKALGTVGPEGVVSGISLSRDDHRIVAEITDPAHYSTTLCSFESETGRTARLAFGEGSNTQAVFSPDGSRVAFSND